jgi:transcriptional regulator of acetoin/glycerol metabolism
VTPDDLPPEVRRPSPTSRAPRRRPRPALATRRAPAGRSLGGPSAEAGSPPPALPAPAGAAAAGTVDDWDAELTAYQRQRLLDALEEARGNKSEAARLLGMPRTTLCSKLKKYGLG